MTDADRRRIARLDQIDSDIAGVEEQVAAGELDADTAAQLVEGYQSERQAVMSAPVEEVPQPRWDRRRVVGAALLVGALIAVSVLALAAIRPRSDGFITGDSVGGVDLDTITNDQMEAVIAANAELPEVAAMRVALADRYFDETLFQDALPHYLAALEGDLDRSRQARSLARIGWMTFVTGVPDVAEEYLLLAIDTDPGYDEAHLFLGLLRLAECDPQGAKTELEPLLDVDGVPDDVRADIADAIGRADELITSGTCG